MASWVLKPPAGSHLAALSTPPWVLQHREGHSKLGSCCGQWWWGFWKRAMLCHFPRAFLVSFLYGCSCTSTVVHSVWATGKRQPFLSGQRPLSICTMAYARFPAHTCAQSPAVPPQGPSQILCICPPEAHPGPTGNLP